MMAMEAPQSSGRSPRAAVGPCSAVVESTGVGRSDPSPVLGREKPDTAPAPKMWLIEWLITVNNALIL